MIITVDGPAASGKGTIARALAEHYGLPLLDTGLLYRAVGLGVLRAGGDLSDEGDAFAACEFSETMLSDPAIRSEAASRAASIVSAHPIVRTALLDYQRAFATQEGGAVLDGRDIGTVIAPDADAKLYVTAPAKVRARRRVAQLAEAGIEVAFDHVLTDIESRDARDRDRAAAPLAQAADADLLETGEMTISEAIQRAIALVEARTGM